MKRKAEMKVASKLTDKLANNGIKVNIYLSKTSKSVYLKLDYGACGGIRISDHKGKKKYKYMFNVLKNYKGPKIVKEEKYTRFFYNYDNAEKLVQNVQDVKKHKLEQYGSERYKNFMLINSRDELYERFKKVA